MLNGLEILIERMKTHPDEFQREGKWVDMLVNIDKHLTDEERQSLKQGFSDAAREKFNELVLMSIAGENINWDDVVGLAVSYESIMAYPMEKRRMYEEEQKMHREMQLEREKAAIAMEREQQRRYSAQQTAQGYGIANQSMLGSRGIW